MKKRNLLLFPLLLNGLISFGQCPEITCPGNISVTNDATNCGATVTYSAPQAIDPCSSTNQTFNYTGSIQTFVVPSGVTTLEVECIGAEGGNGNQATSPAGLGAFVAGDITVTPGETLEIIVGQSGVTGTSGLHGGGGGGGTFVIRQSGNTPLVIAGGGGGGSYQASTPGFDASISTTAGAGGYTSPNIGDGGFTDNGGGGGTGAGGGGWNSSGQSNNWASGGILQGGPGGTTAYSGQGGYGGGGASYHGGGGGGGYSGGSGGTYTIGGGGGASYNTGTNQVMTAGVGSGNGQVVLTYGSSSSLTTTQLGGMASGSIFPVGTTTNTFEVNDGNGNTDQCFFDIVVLDGETPTPDVATLQDVVAACEVSTLDVPTSTDVCDGTINGISNAVFPITSTTVVVWTYEDVAGNTITQNQNVVISGLDLSLSVSGATLTSNEPGVSYQWIDCSDNSIVNGANNQNFTPSSNGDYAVIVTDGNCSDTSACESVTTVGLENNQFANGVSVYPNPNNGSFKLNFGQLIENGEVYLLDVQGRVVQSMIIENTQEVNVNNTHDAGVYLIRIATEKGQATIRVLKNK